jgi:hypothetical protein
MDETSGKTPIRRPWHPGPDPEAGGLLALSDEDLLHQIESLPEDHAQDEALLRVVCSDRHFFLRQAAAKRMRDTRPLLNHANDRHVGQILARRLSRIEDVDYLEHLAQHSHHLDVRKAARAQLTLLRRAPESGAGAPCLTRPGDR